MAGLRKSHRRSNHQDPRLQVFEIAVDIISFSLPRIRWAAVFCIK